jgi:hypothetical protein
MHRVDPPRFYVVRSRLSTGLLLFIVLAGLPMLSMHSLRNRLSDRILLLRAALSGDIEPACAQVGSNPGGFPKEYEVPVPKMLQIPGLQTVERNAKTMIAPGIARFDPQKVRRELPMPEVPSQETRREPPLEPQPQSIAAASEKQESDVQFRQGNGEKNAYDLLLRSSTSIADLVRGRNSSLRFTSWDAAHKGDDVYLVRLKFQSEGNPDVEYIWEVKLNTSEVTPLSYNAKTID